MSFKNRFKSFLNCVDHINSHMLLRRCYERTEIFNGKRFYVYALLNITENLCGKLVRFMVIVSRLPGTGKTSTQGGDKLAEGCALVRRDTDCVLVTHGAKMGKFSDFSK